MFNWTPQGTMMLLTVRGKQIGLVRQHEGAWVGYLNSTPDAGEFTEQPLGRGDSKEDCMALVENHVEIIEASIS